MEWKEIVQLLPPEPKEGELEVGGEGSVDYSPELLARLKDATENRWKYKEIIDERPYKDLSKEQIALRQRDILNALENHKLDPLVKFRKNPEKTLWNFYENSQTRLVFAADPIYRDDIKELGPVNIVYGVEHNRVKKTIEWFRLLTFAESGWGKPVKSSEPLQTVITIRSPHTTYKSVNADIEIICKELSTGKDDKIYGGHFRGFVDIATVELTLIK